MRSELIRMIEEYAGAVGIQFGKVTFEIVSGKVTKTIDEKKTISGNDELKRK